MNIRLTEEMIRGRANNQSFEKGQSYYRSFWSHLQSNAGGCGRRRDIDGALRGKFRPIVSPACKVGFLLICRSMSTDGNGWLGSWISAAFAMIVTTTN